MIYILEGHNCAGKSTYAKTLNAPIKKKAYTNLKQIEHELSNEDDVCYDRLFGYGYMYSHKTDDDLRDLNGYLKSLPNVKCYKFTTDLPSIISWLQERHLFSESEATRIGKETYEWFNHAFEIMDVFEEKKDLE